MGSLHPVPETATRSPTCQVRELKVACGRSPGAGPNVWALVAVMPEPPNDTTAASTTETMPPPRCAPFTLRGCAATVAEVGADGAVESGGDRHDGSDR